MPLILSLPSAKDTSTWFERYRLMRKCCVAFSLNATQHFSHQFSHRKFLHICISLCRYNVSLLWLFQIAINLLKQIIPVFIQDQISFQIYSSIRFLPLIHKLKSFCCQDLKRSRADAPMNIIVDVQHNLAAAINLSSFRWRNITVHQIFRQCRMLLSKQMLLPRVCVIIPSSCHTHIPPAVDIYCATRSKMSSRFCSGVPTKATSISRSLSWG